MNTNESIKFLRDLAAARASLPPGTCKALHEVADDLQRHENQVTPFLTWAQGYLDPGRWAGHTAYFGIQTELIERDAEAKKLRLDNSKLSAACASVVTLLEAFEKVSETLNVIRGVLKGVSK